VIIGLLIFNTYDLKNKKNQQIDNTEITKNRASSIRGGGISSERKFDNRDTRAAKDKSESNSNSAEAEIYPEVDALVGNTNLSNEETARGLISIVARNSASLGEREEALSHAMLLTADEKFNSICELTKDQAFPVELADMVATELYNRPLSNQIEGSLILLDNLDVGVSGRAAELLSFVIEREDLQHQINELRAEALKKMHAIAVDAVKPE
jgi:hypothetical protein